ncbi:MAG: hypothetical protein WC551_12735 [Patescibacteria group bacterium]
MGSFLNQYKLDDGTEIAAKLNNVTDGAQRVCSKQTILDVPAKNASVPSEVIDDLHPVSDGYGDISWVPTPDGYEYITFDVLVRGVIDGSCNCPAADVSFEIYSEFGTKGTPLTIATIANQSKVVQEGYWSAGATQTWTGVDHAVSSLANNVQTVKVRIPISAASYGIRFRKTAASGNPNGVVVCSATIQ